eukprot:TRINITY_DN11353_c0_g1_i7.p1 TRINITY_DN11353_c0_g1~~TRINITY_DN11353_c0_g1_i7.p1  ORF type:complete len:729 (+),score=185.61 TRINITY_DN11353_c0_g1_i7:99-2285(+)
MEALKVCATASLAGLSNEAPVTMDAEQAESEKTLLLKKVSDAIKAVQAQFAGKPELAVASEAKVATLITQLETCFLHGLKAHRKLKVELTFWPLARDLLDASEVVHFNVLRNITTDSGRGRAWLRTALNEQTLQAFFKRLTAHPEVVRNYYDDHSILLDEDRASVLAMLFQGLESTHFALEVDNSNLNSPHRTAWSASTSSSSSHQRTGSQSHAETAPVAPAPTETNPGTVPPTEPEVTDSGFVKEHVAEVVGHEEITIVKAKKKSKKSRKKKRASASDVESSHRRTESNTSDISVGQDARQSNEPAPISLDESMEVEEGEVDFAAMTTEELSAHVEAALSATRATSVDEPTPAPSEAPEISSNSSELKASISSANGDHSGHSTQLNEALEMECDKLRQEVSELTGSRDQLEQRLKATTQAHEMAKQAFEEAVDEHIRNLQSLSKENALLKDKLRAMAKENHELRQEIMDEDPGDNPPDGESPGETDDDLQGFGSIDEMMNHHTKQITQLAEMHSEVLELNERLQEQLQQRDAQVRQLGGVVPSDSGRPVQRSTGKRADSLTRVSTPGRLQQPPSAAISGPGLKTPISVWIPTALLRGKGSDSYHVYQVVVRIGLEEWSVFRRYSHFEDLHRQVQHTFPGAGLTFPGKKSFSRKSAQFVETRRKQLDAYMRKVLSLCVKQQRSPLFKNPCKATLVDALPFLKEKLKAGNGSTKPSVSKASAGKSYGGL